MSNDRRPVEVLVVNGVNTGFGGAVAEVMRTWEASFRERNVSFERLETVPRFGYGKKSRSYLLALALYFLPGSIFRLWSAPVFELAYKLSPALILRFLRAQARLEPRTVVFSHHASFYLSLFTRRARRVFAIHDLLYVRAKSFGASRRLQRLTLAIELWVYRLSPEVLILSYQEWRVLKRFLGDRARVHLIGCYPLTVPASARPCRAGEFAVISDWRRAENVHGAVHFFSQGGAAAAPMARDLRFRIFGFGSKLLAERLRSIATSPGITITDGGVFQDLSSIEEGYFFVPIYRGAGIKIKTLKALCDGRVVVGTRAAFIGLPPWILSEVTRRVTSLADLQRPGPAPSVEAFARALARLREVFQEIGDVPAMRRAIGLPEP